MRAAKMDRTWGSERALSMCWMMAVTLFWLKSPSADAADVCEAYTRVSLLRTIPHHNSALNLRKMQIKIENTSYFIEYDEIEDIQSEKMNRLYIDGKTRTIFKLSYHHYLFELCADESSSLQKYAEVPLFWFPRLTNLQPVQYMGDNETVRDIPVEHWRYCPGGNFSLDVYFTKKDNIGVDYLGNQVPVRIIEKGVRSSVASGSASAVTYDIIIDPNSVYPHPVFSEAADIASCTKSGDVTAVRPPRPDSYCATVVMSFARQKYSTTRHHFYDHEMKLASSNMLILHGHDYMKRFGHAYVTIVHDYGDDLQYVIDRDQGNCTVEPLPRGKSKFPFSGPWDPAAVNTPGLFDLSAFNLTSRPAYRTWIRDIVVDVWVGARTDWPRPGVNCSVKAYYTNNFWATAGADIDEVFIERRLKGKAVYGSESMGKVQLVGLAYQTTDDTTVYGQEIPDFTHVYEYSVGIPRFSVFDVSACYRNDQIKRLTFSVRACYRVLLRHDPGLFEAAVRQFIVDTCGITAIRVSNVQVVASPQNRVDIHVTLLDVPPLKGDAISKSTVGVEYAVWRLGLAIDKQDGVGITVNYPEGTTIVRVLPGSLRTGEKTANSYETGHTAGIVAVICVITVVCGLFLAPAAAYVIYTKRISFPYLIQ